MTGKRSRTKGAKGQSEVARLLGDRDWTVDPITAGVKREDIIATDPAGRQWSVEVKKQKTIDLDSFRRQARDQAKTRKLPWMLFVHLHGTCFWLVFRQGGSVHLW
jgi:hypothetical protein